MKSLKQTFLKFPLVPKVFAVRPGSLSKHFRDEGDKLFAAGKNIDALIWYNKSLCHAEQGSSDACETFMKRSEVYFEARHYEACLVNIQHAKDHGHKGDDAVNHRESWCKQSSHEKSKESTWDVFNLSHPRRQNLPFVADCLELKENERFGRHIVTSQSLRPGTVVAVEETLFKFPNLKAMDFFKHQRCFNCLRTNKLNLVPSHSVMACSQACHNAIGHQNIASLQTIESHFGWAIAKMVHMTRESVRICGSVRALEAVASANTATVFDFDFGDMESAASRQNLLKCTISLSGGLEKCVKDEDVEHFKLSLGHDQNGAFLASFAQHLMAVCAMNQYSMQFYDPLKGEHSNLGNCMLPFGSLINHSCDPNVVWVLAENKFVFIAVRPIQAGAQLFHCYRKTFVDESFGDRQAQLLKHYGFECKCEACTEKYPTLRNSANINLNEFPSRDAIQTKLTENWMEIEELHCTQRHGETTDKVLENKRLLELLAWKSIL